MRLPIFIVDDLKEDCQGGDEGRVPSGSWRTGCVSCRVLANRLRKLPGEAPLRQLANRLRKLPGFGEPAA